MKAKGAMGRTIIATGPVTVPVGLAESVAVTVMVVVPAVVGVPLMRQPVRVRPAGRVPLVSAQA